jgi:hypothetical protein
MSVLGPAIVSASFAALALFAVGFAAPHASAQGASAITEFSSEQFDPKKLRGAPQKQAPKINVQPRVTIQPRVNIAPRNNFVPRNTVSPRIIQGPGNNTVIRTGPNFRRGPSNAFRGPIGVTTFRGARANFIRGPHRFFRNGRYIPFIAIGGLTAIAIGSRQYRPYAFVDGPSADICQGPTDDGLCELRMTEVPLEDGTTAMQCVSYCAQGAEQQDDQ